MDAIKLAIQQLHNDPIIMKACTTALDVEDAISQLSSTVILFELSSTSNSTFLRLAELLRGRLLPLYRTSLLLTLDYTVAIFRYVHQHKILTTNHAKESRRSWESVLESLFSGVLDFLEENASSKHRESVGSALYPMLCSLFFCEPGAAPLDFDGSLLSTVYQLLMTTVESTPRNAMKLRGSELGSKKLGLTVSQTKEFLALESLLELFALLIPPLKSGRDKRTQFIKEVFDSSIFSCSDRVIRILEDIANPDWSVTSAEIIKALAEPDILFPQSFEISRLSVNEAHIDTSSFYIDKTKFVANIDEDSKIETLHIPFTTIWKISASVPIDDEARVTVRIMEPPILGDRPIHVDKIASTELTISWQLGYKSLQRFEKALKARNLKSVDIRLRRKQSKTEEISLDFESEQQESLALRRDKVQSLSQLWADKTPSSKRSGQDYSTPLVAPDSHPKVKSEGKARLEAAKPVRDHGSGAIRFVDSNDNICLESHANQMFHPKDLEQDLQVDEIQIAKQHDDSSEEISAPKSNATNTRRRFLSLSDDDIVEVVDGKDKQAGKFKSPRTGEGVVTLSDNDKPPREKPLQTINPTVNSIERLPAPKESNNDRLKNGDKIVTPVKRPVKRSFNAIKDEHPLTNREGARYSKRLRLETKNSPIMPGRPQQKIKDEGSTKQTAGTSSPLPLERQCDEVPRLTKEPKRALMKGKNGKTATANKRAPLKKFGKAVEKKPELDDPKTLVQRHVESDPDITLIESNDKADNSKRVVNLREEKFNRRSARVATIEISKKTDQKQGIANTRKPKKAPWEERDFLQKKDIASNAMDDNLAQDGKLSSKNQDRSCSTPMKEGKSELSAVQSSSDNQTIHAETFTDYIVPTMLDSTALDSPMPVTKSEVVMIDLTHDVSPQKLPLRKALSIENIKDYSTVEPEPSEETDFETLFTSDLSKKQAVFESTRTVVPAGNPKKNIVKPAMFEQHNTNALAQDGSPSQRTTLHKVKFAPTESSPLSRLQVPRSSGTKSDKMESYHEIVGDMHKLRSPALKIRESIGSNARIQKMKSLDSVTDDTDGHCRRPSVKFDLPNTRKHPLTHEFKQDKVQSRGRIADRDDTSREAEKNEKKFSPIRRHRQARSNNLTFQPAAQPMDKIINILDELNEGLINKVAGRFKGVSTELHAGQRIILEGTARRLKEMSDASIHHFNDLVDLEAEYTAQCMAISNGVHNFRKTTEQLNECFKGILIEHSSRSLCKKFPSTLFPQVPEVISNPGLRR